jgi:lambda family phage minor tail protein L
MSLLADIQEYQPGQKLDLYLVDFTTTKLESPPATLHMYPGIKQNYGTLTFGGQDYTPWPLEITGFKKASDGPMPRPSMKISNVTGFISSQLLLYNDFLGAKVSRYRTFAKYLDGQPLADSGAKMVEIYFIEQKKKESKAIVELELVTAIDIMDQDLPSRVMFNNTCMWEYRGTDCGWDVTDTTRLFDSNDGPVNTLDEDVCGKRLTSCKNRFCNPNAQGYFATPNISLPYGAFPALGRTK